MFHPQLGGPHIIPGLLVLALSTPLGTGTAQWGNGPERPKDELLTPHLALQGAMPCADPEKGSNRPVETDPQPVFRGSPSQWWSQMTPLPQGDGCLCPPVLRAHPGLASRSSLAHGSGSSTRPSLAGASSTWFGCANPCHPRKSRQQQLPCSPPARHKHPPAPLNWFPGNPLQVIGSPFWHWSFRAKLLGFHCDFLEHPGCGKSQGSAGMQRAKYVLVLAMLAVKPLTS